MEQNEAFQKILLNKIEKLKKQNDKLREEGQKAQTELYFEKKKTEKLEEIKEEYWEKGWQNGKEDCYAEYDEGHALKEENKKLKEEAKKIEKAVRDVGHGDTIDACLPIWYDQEED